MAFIKATRAMNSAQITINVDHIVAVANNEGQAIVHTSVSSQDGGVQYRVEDGYEAILTKIEVATDLSLT